MRFAVCIKQVPDVTAPFHIQNGELVFDTGRTVLNAYDASAVEEAVVLREKYGDAIERIDVVSIGPDAVKETIRKALAMGADEGMHLETDDAGYDAWAYATILARHFEEADYDVILCGKQAQDTDAGLTGSMLAALLDLSYTTNAVGLDVEPESNTVVVERQGDAGTEIIELNTPCLVTCSNDMNDPRIPKLKGIMMAKRKPLETVPVADMGVEASSRTKLMHYEEMPEREPGEKLDGEPEEMARELVQHLKDMNVA